MRNPIAAAVAIAFGLIVLLGYFIPLGGVLQTSRDVFLAWAIVLAGTATLIGILNLVRAHWRKMTVRAERDPYSPVLILAFLLTAGAGFVLGGPSDPRFQQVVNSIQVPVETSLMAVLTFTLALAGARILQRRWGWAAVIFAGSVLVYLLLNSGFLAREASLPFLSVVLGALQRLPIAGMRGILLGIALGSLTTGLRILMGVDRPYSG